MNWQFPQYRQSANGLNLYRVDSDVAFTELQFIGEKILAFEVRASTYPERLRIQDLLNCVNDSCSVIPAERFQEVLGQVTLR